MKTSSLVIALFFMANRLFAQVPSSGSLLIVDPRATAAEAARVQAGFAEQAREQAIQAEILAAEQAELAKIYSKDPWRRIGETTNLARGSGWNEFQGEVQETVANGVVFKGRYGPVLTVNTDPSYEQHLVQRFDSNQQRQKIGQSTQTTVSQVRDTSFQRKIIYGDDLFFVEGFPYPASIGQGYEELMALDSDYFSYTNQNSQVITIHKLIYGMPCQKIWSAEEMVAAKAKTDAKKQAVVDKVLKSHQDLADKGDAYGLLRMGERYRDGEGVTKDLAKARDYLTKAAAAGSSTADDDLKKLPANQP
jgi:hypothetical protein